MKRDWRHYLKKEIWRVNLESLPKWKGRKVRLMRILILISQGFTKSQIQQGASSLTYYTLIGIVPIIALLIGLAQLFALEHALKTWLQTQFVDQKEVINKIFDFSKSSLETAHQGLIAGIGIVILLWAGVKIFLYIEKVLNTIWEVKKGRSLMRRFTDYLSMLLLCPLIILLSSGVTVYLTAALTALTSIGFFGHIQPFILPLLNLIPVVLICLLLTFLYIFMPNTRVRFLPALSAGVSAGLIYQVIQWVFLYFQVGVSKYNAIYGTFAALPLFLIWIHISWVIVLLGAKMSFAFQKVKAFDFLSENVHLCHRMRVILSLQVIHLCIKNFCQNSPPLTDVEISNHLSISLPITSHFLSQLTEAGLLTEIKRDKDKETGFSPSPGVDQLTIKRVIDMIDVRGEEIPLPPSRVLASILDHLEKISQALEKSEGNVLLKDI
ncbi:MAG: hypothetical protein S4CHLAM2_00480 [Chlamydiales bacterium]|nr:hypothetical protein [Chlamydiales bacterium]